MARPLKACIPGLSRSLSNGSNRGENQKEKNQLNSQLSALTSTFPKYVPPPWESSTHHTLLPSSKEDYD